MKHRVDNAGHMAIRVWALAIVALFCMVVLGGCAGQGADGEDAGQAPAAGRNPAVEQPDTQQPGDPQASEQERSDDAKGSSGQSVADPDSLIGEEAAIEAALSHAQVDQSDASYLIARLGYDDGQPIYDVEFYVGPMEYSYEINAETGAVVEYDIDRS